MKIKNNDGVDIAVVKITAADYNPHAKGNPFDGSPFSSIPVWMQDLLESTNTIPNLKIHPNNEADYAMWDFIDKEGVLHTIGPGDYLVGTSIHDISVVTGAAADLLRVLDRKLDLSNHLPHSGPTVKPPNADFDGVVGPASMGITGSK